MCYFSRSCAGFSIPSSLDQCVATGLSHEDENGVCTTFPVGKVVYVNYYCTTGSAIWGNNQFEAALVVV